MSNSDLRTHLQKNLDKGFRYDDRQFTEYRDIAVEVGVVATAEGSARVTIGETVVIAGVKTEIGTPYPDSPDEGTIMVGVELSPLSNPEFELGPPGSYAIELARVVDRGIRESKVLDFKKLIIKEGEKCWILTIDIAPLNDAGNLFDACSLAALAAIKDARFPLIKEGNQIDYKTKTDQRMPINAKKDPIEVTVLKIGKHFLVDPLKEEEQVFDSRLTVSITKEGKICALQKGGATAITMDDINAMLDIAIEKSAELRSALERCI